jgi:hypothetical protein
VGQYGDCMRVADGVSFVSVHDWMLGGCAMCMIVRNDRDGRGASVSSGMYMYHVLACSYLVVYTLAAYLIFLTGIYFTDYCIK